VQLHSRWLYIAAWGVAIIASLFEWCLGLSCAMYRLAGLAHRCGCVSVMLCNFSDVLLQHSYGFIRCLEREARLFFHYSEFGGDADTMRTGGDCSAVSAVVRSFCLTSLLLWSYSRLPFARKPTCGITGADAFTGLMHFLQCRHLPASLCKQIQWFNSHLLLLMLS